MLLQKQINKAVGYDKLDTDGWYGGLTKSEVTNIQEQTGLPATGVVDQSTMPVYYQENLSEWIYSSA